MHEASLVPYAWESTTRAPKDASDSPEEVQQPTKRTGAYGKSLFSILMSLMSDGNQKQPI